MMTTNKLHDQMKREYPEGNAALDAKSPFFASQLLASILIMSCNKEIKENIHHNTNLEAYNGFDTNGVFVFACIREYLFPNTTKFQQAVNSQLSKFDTFTGTYKDLLGETNLLRSLSNNSEQQVAEVFVRLMAHHLSETVYASFIPMNAKAVTGTKMDALTNILEMALRFLENPDYRDIKVVTHASSEATTATSPAQAEASQEQHLLTLVIVEQH